MRLMSFFTGFFREEKKSRILALAALLCIIIGVSCFLQFSYDKLQQDDYFHIRLAEMMREDGLIREFPWLSHSAYRENFADNKLLYRLILIPFTFGDLILTGKLAAVLLLAVLGACFMIFLPKNDISYPLFWSLLLVFSSRTLLIRLLSVRPISLGILMLLVGTHLLLKEKYVWLTLLGYLFVLTYGTFILFIVMTAVYVLSYLIYYGRLKPGPLLYSLAGTAGGIVINPYFPKNIKLLVTAFLRGSVRRTGLEPNLEWLPPISWNFFMDVWPVLLVLAAILLLTLKKREKLGFAPFFLFFQSAVFLGLYFRVFRGIDQFVPFALLFAAFAFSELKIRIPRPARYLLFILPLVLLCINGYAVYRSFQQVEMIDNRGSALWLKENTPEKSLVFVSNYGAFPQLFFYNTHNVYTSGLDPNLMKEYDERLYSLFEDVIWLRKNPHTVIGDEFGARWVHVEKIGKNMRLYEHLSGNPYVYRKMYEDDFSAIFLLRERKDVN